MEREHPELCEWGDMPYELVERISKQIPTGIVVQLHDNGESLLYPRLADALDLFKRNIRCFNTNAKLLLEKADEIIDHAETVTISVIQNDEEGDAQFQTVRDFIAKRGSRKPFLVYRLLGKVDQKERWGDLPGIVATRVLHDAEGSRNYERPVTVPEHGICLDLLNHMAIDRYGNISLCVRFDPAGHLRIGHIDTGLEAAWQSEKRQRYIQWHMRGNRDMLPGCSSCHYYGVPRGNS